MNLQYISDSEGNPTGVFIPLKDWKKLKKKYSELENDLAELPEWHISELDKRIKNYEMDPEQILDFDKAMEDIEKDL